MCPWAIATEALATRYARALSIAVAVLGITVLLDGVSTAPAHAAPVPMAAQHSEKATRDGWQLALSLDNELVNSVPNLANATNSREAFVTLSATASVTGGSAPISDSTVIAGYQLGCQSDVSSGLGIGGAGAFGPSASIGTPLAIPGQTAANVGIAGGLTGFIQTTIQPGVIVEVPMANMPLSPSGSAMLDIDNIHIKADACGGDVTIRSYCYLRISTDEARNELAVYGDPIKI